MGSYEDWLDEMRVGMKSLRLESQVFFFVRHGTTAMNKKGLMIGHADIPLDSEGYMQAEDLATKLKELGITSIYSSDLSRTRQTSEVIGRVLNLPVLSDWRLRTRNYGSLQGQKKPSGNAIITPADAEPVTAFTRRLTSVFNEILDQNSRRPVIVSHGGVRDALDIGLDIRHEQEKKGTCVLIKFERIGIAWKSDLIC